MGRFSPIMLAPGTQVQETLIPPWPRQRHDHIKNWCLNIFLWKVKVPIGVSGLGVSMLSDWGDSVRTGGSDRGENVRIGG